MYANIQPGSDQTPADLTDVEKTEPRLCDVRIPSQTNSKFQLVLHRILDPDTKNAWKLHIQASCPNASGQ